MFKKLFIILICLFLLVNVNFNSLNSLNNIMDETVLALDTYTPGSWPDSFLDYTTKDGTGIKDIAGESGISPPQADLTSGLDEGIGSLQTVYLASDGTNIFFRIRIKDNPFYAKGGGFVSTAWLVNLAVDGVHEATVGLDGKSPSTDYVYVTDSSGNTLIKVYSTDNTGENVPGTRIVNAENGQYFIDFQVPINVLSSVSKIIPSTPVQVYFGSSQAANLAVINKDFMDGDSSAVSFDNLATMKLESVSNSVTPTIDINSDSKFYVNTPTIEGTTTAEDGSKVIVTIDNKNYETSVLNNSWSIKIIDILEDGNYSVKAQVIDTLGNTSNDTDSISIDTKVIINIDGGNEITTSDNTPLITGTSDAVDGSTVTVTINTKEYKTIVSSGTWSVQISETLPNNQYSVSAVVLEKDTLLTDEVTQRLIINVDTETFVTIQSPKDGDTTSDNTPTISGVTEANNTVEIIVDNKIVGTVTADADGKWSYTFGELIDDTYLINVKSTDEYNNEAEDSINLTIDTETFVTIENPTDGDTTSDNTPTISGVTEANNTVEIIVDNKIVGTVTADADGKWSYTFSELLDDTYLINVKSTDQYNNEAEDNINLSIDTETFVTIENPTDGDTTSDNTPTINGVTEANNTVEIVVDNQTVGTVTADADGKWSYTFSELLEGSHIITVEAEDFLGNIDQDTIAIDIEVTYEMTLKAEPEVITADGKSTSKLTIYLTDSLKNPVADKTVYIENTVGTLSALEAKTNSFGIAEVIFTSPDLFGTTETIEEYVTVKVLDKDNNLAQESKIKLVLNPVTINGQIIDEDTKLPLLGAIIEVSEDFDNDGVIDYYVTVKTDINGFYKIPVPKDNYNYTLKIRTEMDKDGNKFDVEFEQIAQIDSINGSGGDIKSENMVTGKVVIKSNEDKNLEYTASLIDEDDNITVNINNDGSFSVTGGESGQEYNININVVVDNQVLVSNVVNVIFPTDGVAEVQIILIDPYGVITDSNTKQPIEDVKVELYWADTALNKSLGRTLHTLVELPIIDGFYPNNNLNEQYSNNKGEYAWMVFPQGDYYIVAEKVGYVTYDSRDANIDYTEFGDSYILDGIIHVENTIVKLDFDLQPKTIDSIKTLPQTGSIISFNLLIILGILLMAVGIIYIKKAKNK